jgi:hypothetical protein
MNDVLMLHRLKEIELRYSQCGWRVFMMTSTAVSDHFGWARFHMYNNSAMLDWGARLEEAAGGTEGPSVNYAKVRVIRYFKNKFTLFIPLALYV